MKRKISLTDAYWKSGIPDDPNLWIVFYPLLGMANSNGRITATLSEIARKSELLVQKHVWNDLKLLESIGEISVQNVAAIDKKGKLLNCVLIKVINYKIYVDL